MDKIIFFNFSKTINIPEFFKLCRESDIIWNGGQSIPNTAEVAAAQNSRALYVHHQESERARSGYSKIPVPRLTKHSVVELTKNYEQYSTILSIYYNLGIMTGDLFLDKPEAVRDIVRAFKNGEDVDAVIVRHLGDTIDNCNHPVVKD